MAVGVSSALSVNDPNNPNIEAVYGAGLGTIFSGSALTIAGLPLTIGGAARIARLKKGGVATGQTTLVPTARGLALTF